jgi:hypothetical protein
VFSFGALKQLVNVVFTFIADSHFLVIGLLSIFNLGNWGQHFNQSLQRVRACGLTVQLPVASLVTLVVRCKNNALTHVTLTVTIYP